MKNLLLLAGAALAISRMRKGALGAGIYDDPQYEVDLAAGGKSRNSGYQQNTSATEAAASLYPEYANVLKEYPVSEAPARPTSPTPSIEWNLPQDVAASIRPAQPVKTPEKKPPQRNYQLPVYDDAYYAAIAESKRLRAEQEARTAPKSIDKLFEDSSAIRQAMLLPEAPIPEYRLPEESSSDRELERYIQQSNRQAQRAAEDAQRARESALELDRIIARESRYGPDNLTQSGRAAVERELLRRQVSPGGRLTQLQIQANAQREMLRRQATQRLAQQRTQRKPQQIAQGSRCTDPKGCVTTAL